MIQEKRRRMHRRRVTTVCIVMLFAVALGLVIGRAAGNGFAGRKTGAEIIPAAADTPFIETAMKQIGHKGGKKYWSWYGFDSRVAWCACYVSWCENKVGYIDEGIAPKFALVSDGAEWFRSKEQWLDAGETPEPGDLIFFDWEADGTLDHVGIVTNVVNGRIFSVEGNSSDRCRLKRYYAGDPVIAGFGHIEATS